MSAELGDAGTVPVQVANQREPDRPRSAYRFEVGGFVLLLLVALVRPQLLITRTDLPPRRELHYLTVGGSIPWPRVLADAGSGEMVEMIGSDSGARSDFDQRRQNLRLFGMAGSNARTGHRDIHELTDKSLSEPPAANLKVPREGLSCAFGAGSRLPG